MEKQPIFVMSSGRSGTFGITEALRSSLPGATIHHEYSVIETQVIGVKWKLGIWNRERALSALREIYLPAVVDDKNSIWIDSSNKLTWIADLLLEIFPNAKFIELVRNGQYVVSSFYNKLQNEMYTPEGIAKLQAFVDGAGQEPSHTKENWWICAPANKSDDPRRTWTRFELCCAHWSESHKEITSFLNKIDESVALTIRLEDLLTKPSYVSQLIQFLGLPVDENAFSKSLDKPRNVYRPEHTQLSVGEIAMFREICSETMTRYGYEIETESHVNYG